MTRKLILYGLIIAVLSIGLKLVEYRFVIMDHSIELYGGIIAGIFTILGVVAGRRLTEKKEVVIERVVMQAAAIPVTKPVPAPDKQLEILGISKREYEILQLMAEGLSNQEIAERSFVSVNTVKTHVSNLLLKLDAKRRTQAVLKAREMQLVP